MFPKIINFSINAVNGSTSTLHIPAPSRCVVKSTQASPNADPGDAKTIVIAKGSNTIGTLTFGSDIAAGATGTYAADSTYGKTVFEAGDVMKLTASDCTAAAVFQGYVEIDEYARKS